MSNYNLNSSTELMQNYVQGSVMGAVDTLTALQTSNATSMLFYIDDNGSLALSQEAAANTPEGWQTMDLSSEFLNTYLPGTKCSNMAVIQYTGPTGDNINTGTITLAMTATGESGDMLCLCTGNSNEDLSWISNPQWAAYTYDNPNTPIAGSLSINNVYLTSTIDGQYIGVDINNATPDSGGAVSRFFIDPYMQQGYAWVQKSMEQFNPEGMISCAGCIPGPNSVQGIYTGGSLNGEGQLIFMPLYNPFSPDGGGNFPTTQLAWPANMIPEAMTAVLNEDGCTTSLFVISQGTLYYYDEASQYTNQLPAALISNNALTPAASWFTGVSDMFAAITGGIMMLWWTSNGSGSNTIYYTSCPAADLGSSTAVFTLPVPLSTNVTCASPYINQSNNANTIFAVANNQLSVLVKSPETTHWSSGQVILPAVAGTPSVSFSSYTTHVTLCDANNVPVSGGSVTITALSSNSFYVNNLYTIIGTSPVTVQADMNGVITIIETATNLTGTQLTISAPDGTTITVNPMDKPFGKIAQNLSTSSGLQSATIYYQTPGAQPKNLLSPGASSNDIATVAAANGLLNTAYQNQGSNTGVSYYAADARLRRVKVVIVRHGEEGMTSFFSDFATDIGDAFQALYNAASTVVASIEQDADGVVNLVVTIANATASLVVATVEDIVSAAQWVISQVVDAVEDIIDFLKFLFDLGTIETVKSVFTNLWSNYINAGVNNLITVQADFDNAMNNASSALAQWSGIPGNAGSTMASQAGSNGYSASANYLAYHYQNNASQSTYTISTITPDSTISGLLQDVLNALEENQSEFSSLWTQLGNLVSNLSNMSIGAVFQAIAELLAETGVDMLKTAGDVLLSLIIAVAEDFMSMLTCPVSIPVLSDILSDFGVSSPSVMEVLGWVAAVPATVIYELATQAKPFSVDEDVTFLQNTSTLPNNGMSSTTGRSADTGSEVGDISSWLNLSETTCVDLCILGTGVACVMKFIYSFTTAGAVAFKGSEGPFNSFEHTSGLVDMAGEISKYIAGIGMDPYPLKNQDMIDLDNYISIITVFNKGVSWYFTKICNQSGSDAATASATFEGITSVLKLIPGVYRCIELGGLVDNASGDALKFAIIDEVSEMTGHLQKIAYSIGVCADGGDEVILAMGAAGIVSTCSLFMQTIVAVEDGSTIYQQIN